MTLKFDPNIYKMNLEEGYKNIISYSGGKDSTSIVLFFLENEIPIDEIVFFDSGWDWPQIYEHNKTLEKYANKRITVLKPEKSFEWWMYEKPCAIGNGKGWPRFNLRWCTGVMQTTIRKYLKSIEKYYNFIGVCYDEGYRLLKKPKNHFKRYKYPLIEHKIKEREAKKMCFEHGFDFGGLYKYMDSTSCWCCPLQPLRSLRNLYRFYPDLWKKLREMGDKTPTPFKIGKTVSDGIFLDYYENRFKEECKQRLIDEYF